jgi:hypothetical protein
VVIVASTSTSIALLGSELLPYAFAVVLSVWTPACGEHEKRKAERQAPPDDDAGTLVRCVAR